MCKGTSLVLNGQFFTFQYSCEDEVDTQRRRTYAPVYTESTNASNEDDSNETCTAAKCGTDPADCAVGR